MTNSSSSISWNTVRQSLQQDWRSLGRRERRRFERLRHVLPWLADPSIWSDSDFVEDVKWKRPAAMLRVATGLASVPVVMNQMRQLESASDAAVLPLRWTTSPHHHAGVPAPIVQIAERIRDRFEEDPETSSRLNGQDLDAFHLQWSPEGWEDVDFRDVDISAESAAAALMIGLASAIERVPMENVFIASGSLSDRSVDGHSTQTWTAEGIERKCRYALDIGFQRFALPENGIAVFDRTAGSKDQTIPSDSLLRLPIEPITQSAGVWPPLDSLKVLTGAPPNRASRREDRVAWYHSLTSAHAAEAFYADCLLQDVADHLRQCIGKFGDNAQAGSICGVYSHAIGLLPLFVAVHRPLHLHVLIGQDVPPGKRDEFRRRVESICQRVEVRFHDVPTDDPIGSIEEVVANLDRQQPVILEALPGYRNWSLAMVLAARPGDRILNWQSETRGHSRRAEPFSLKPTLWRANEQGRPERIIPG
ncbi:hypothetical protein [Aporhodopirellula aestuarii]|uniref:SMODS-associated and fused to various effectors domain-containing protein n=1 Tax=Aporhodopirellula aestuarii TaxID=2950107 RepID=A0ABT0UB52_9BACT|nr:hypothetical protein [Aporhodopirellula aestuarii]MCM2374001.1 hypothetical protein [Aporhodopirellula aestuarii]